MNIAEGFILGLSTGPVCLAYCGPVLVSYLLGEGNKIKQNSINVSIFLSGRLLAYIITGFAAGMLGKTLLQPTHERTLMMSIVYVCLAGYMIFYGFYGFKEICLGRIQYKIKDTIFSKDSILKLPEIVPFIGGVLTGLNLCPPFLAGYCKGNRYRED